MADLLLKIVQDRQRFARATLRKKRLDINHELIGRGWQKRHRALERLNACNIFFNPEQFQRQHVMGHSGAWIGGDGLL